MSSKESGEGKNFGSSLPEKGLFQQERIGSTELHFLAPGASAEREQPPVEPFKIYDAGTANEHSSLVSLRGKDTSYKDTTVNLEEITRPYSKGATLELDGNPVFVDEKIAFSLADRMVRGKSANRVVIVDRETTEPVVTGPNYTPFSDDEKFTRAGKYRGVFMLLDPGGSFYVGEPYKVDMGPSTETTAAITVHSPNEISIDELPYKENPSKLLQALHAMKEHEEGE